MVQHEVKEDATCTLPIALLSRLKMQHTSKAVCVPREGGPPVDAAMACIDALVAAGVTKRMPGAYMAEWPDEVTGAGFDSISPYERRARDLIFRGCIEMGALREGRFRCGQARADHVIQVTKRDEQHVVVRYSREVTLDPQLAEIDKACGPTNRPAPEGLVTLEKIGKGWALADTDPSTASPSSSTP